MKKIHNFKNFVNEQYNEESTVETTENAVEETTSEATSEETTEITTESVDEKKDNTPKKPAKYKSVKDDDFVFSHGGKVEGWHFPINTKARAKNALQRANQFDSAPEWYNGSLKSLVTKVANMVKKKYPDIEVTEKSKKPGKG